MAAPVEYGTSEETFRTLGEQFGLDVKIATHLADNVGSLEDFRYSYTSDTDVSESTIKAVSVDNPRLQAARLRKAWHAVVKAFVSQEQQRQRIIEDDIDTILDKPDLDALEEIFYSRYKLRFPAHMTPSDSLLSRIFREVERRALQIKDLWKIKTLTSQSEEGPKRRKLAPHLFTDIDTESEVPVDASVDAYFDNMATYLLALAKAGAKALTPTPQQPERLSSNATDYVQIPYEVLQAYFHRARRYTASRPKSDQLRALMKLDLSERAVWTQQFRESKQTLGQVISSVMKLRDAHWEIEDKVPTALSSNVTQDARNKPKGPPQPAQSRVPVVSKTLRDGTELCPDFQLGKCGAKAACPKGAHRCAVELTSGRVCGTMAHGANGCDNKRAKHH